jgi:uroporphyrinogen decarboxylase
MIRNDLLLRTLRKEKVERPPVWLMRQAGRYLPDYMKLKEKYSFFERIQNPELATQITLQPVDQLGVDAAIIFSDILVVASAMGLEVQLIENKGPYLPEPIKTEKDLSRISLIDPREKLSYVFDALKMTKNELNDKIPLIGFAGAPWTLLCYMVQGGGSKTFDEARAFCYTRPALAHQILQMITDTTIAYLKEQVKSGADLIQVFDSWGGLLGPAEFELFSLRYLRQIVAALKNETLVILFAKGAWHALGVMAETGAHGLGIDWCIMPEIARTMAGPEPVLQGNFDPAKLLSPIPQIMHDVKIMLDSFANYRHVANLGHGILPNIPVDHARAFVDTVKEYAYSGEIAVEE